MYISIERTNFPKIEGQGGWRKNRLSNGNICPWQERNNREYLPPLKPDFPTVTRVDKLFPLRMT